MKSRSGLLSLSLHGAHNLRPENHSINQSNNQSDNQSVHQSVDQSVDQSINQSLSPIAIIRLPHCSRSYQTRAGKGADPVWADFFDFVLSFDHSNQSMNQSITDYSVYDIDEEFEEIDRSIDQNDDVILIEVIDNINDRNVIGRAKLTVDQISQNQSNNQSINQLVDQSINQSNDQASQSKMSISLDGNSGVVELSASWTDTTVDQSNIQLVSQSQSPIQSISPLTTQSIHQSIRQSISQSNGQSIDQSHGYEKRGRFLISDEDYQSNSDKSIGQSSDQSSSQSTNQSTADESEEISATASTDTNLTNDQSTDQPISQPKKVLSDQALLDRRSSSHESNQPTIHQLINQSLTESIDQSSLTSVQYSFPLLEDTYTRHQNRHVASFLPTLTKSGHPFFHSTGRHGLLYDDSTTFDDRNFLQSTIQSINQSINQSSSSGVHTSVCEIRVWSRDFIHGVQVTYALSSHNQSINQSVVDHFPGPKHVGRVHTTEHVLKLHHSDGEYIIGVEGTYREWIETLTIVTNRRAHTFGGNIDARITKWKPAGSPKLPISFRCDVPPGHRVVAFIGGYGVHLHNIGVVHAPIAKQDGKAKSTGIFSTLKKKFSQTRLDTLDH